MQFRVLPGPYASLAVEALVVGVFSDKRLDGAAAEVDALLGGTIAEILSSGEIAGKSGERSLVHSQGQPFKRVLVVGLGDRAKFEPSALAKYAGAAVRYLGKRNVKDVAFALPLEAAHHVRPSASFVAEGAIAAKIDTTIYRTEPDHPVAVENVAIVTKSGEHEFSQAALEEGIAHGAILGEAVNLARTMALRPGNEMTPKHMAKHAEEVAARHGLEFHALDEAAMTNKGMGAILGVSRGSDEEARMIVLEYRGDPESTEKLALVGKGLTFDSGGISIKPAEKMEEMKYDMCGGAGVIAAMSAIAQLKPKLNVIGVVPSTENLPGPRAVKPGDILRAMNGKTIEVINTDAEGRLILADGLCYARELGATKIVDAATLTGAVVVALGHAAAGTMSNDDAFVGHFLSVVKHSGERYWHMPLYDEFATTVKSEIADLRNSTGRWGGSLTAGKFLESFVEKVPWIHLDIAGTAYVDTESAHMAKGPTGVPVRAFVALVEDMAKHAVHANGSAKAKAPA